MDNIKQNKILGEAVRLLARKCPRLVSLCYWAGTSSISLEELGHRQSFDLDFHTYKALDDVRPVLSEIQKVFPGSFEIIQAPDNFGSGFSGTLTLPGGEKITIEVLSNYEDVRLEDLVASSSAKGLKRVSIGRYLADKIQCVAERLEARDLVDIYAVLRNYPHMEARIKFILSRQDAILITERLFSWTDKQIVEDLNAYRDVNPGDAIQMRGLLLKWIKEDQG